MESCVLLLDLDLSSSLANSLKICIESTIEILSRTSRTRLEWRVMGITT